MPNPSGRGFCELKLERLRQIWLLFLPFLEIWSGWGPEGGPEGGPDGVRKGVRMGSGRGSGRGPEGVRKGVRRTPVWGVKKHRKFRNFFSARNPGSKCLHLGQKTPDQKNDKKGVRSEGAAGTWAPVI